MIKRVQRSGAGFCFAMMLLLGNVISAAAVLPETERAIADGNWKAVIEYAKGDDPVARFIRAHALLAENQNNESLCILEGLTESAALTAWDKWTADFVTRSPESPFPLYLRGDALTRLKEWSKADDVFNEALALAPENALVLNARGSAFAARGMWDQARVDFAAASDSSPDFADAFANRGLVYILQKNPGPWAEVWLTRALERSPSFAIALNARGAIRVGAGDLDGAAQDFDKARLSCECMVVAVDNQLSLDIIRIGLQESSLQKILSTTTPGTEIFSATSQQQQALSTLKGRLQIAQTQLRTPSDSGIPALASDLNKAIDISTPLKSIEFPSVDLSGGKLSVSNILNSIYQSNIHNLNVVSSYVQMWQAVDSDLTTSLQRNFEAVRTNMVQFPNGQAAQDWASRGYTAQNLTLDVFRNPPSQLGGVSLGGTRIDDGRSAVVVWLGLWYPPAIESK